VITPTIIAGPAKEPVTLQEIKNQLRIDGSTEDTLLYTYLRAARSYVEGQTGRTIHETTLEWVLDVFPSENYVILPRATPLIEIVTVKYKDSSGSETTWDSSEYIEDTDSIPGQLVLGYNESWPSFTAYPVSPIRVRYKAGLASTPAVTADETIKVPILLLVGGLYENRESVVVSDKGAVAQVALDYGVEAFIAQNVATYVF
jgi:uncharacterized phiE125 gp8 family phage protein